MSDPADDPYLLTLGQIAAELTAIRQELQKFNAGPEDDSPERFDCRCGAIAYGEENAKRHAVDDHNAPESMWRETYEQ